LDRKRDVLVIPCRVCRRPRHLYGLQSAPTFVATETRSGKWFQLAWPISIHIWDSLMLVADLS
jgi:hypothetical protein